MKTLQIKKDFCIKPCVECPFKKSSIKGYLGGFTIEETLDTANSEADFLCHVSGRREVKKQCAGRMLFATKRAKNFRNEKLENIRKQVKDSNPNFNDDILGFDFKSHHANL
jgi:hypothetical protein